MKLQRFLNYLSYKGTTCPCGIHQSRWQGMLKWFATRQQLRDHFVVPPKPARSARDEQ